MKLRPWSAACACIVSLIVTVSTPKLANATSVQFSFSGTFSAVLSSLDDVLDINGEQFSLSVLVDENAGSTPTSIDSGSLTIVGGGYAGTYSMTGNFAIATTSAQSLNFALNEASGSAFPTPDGSLGSQFEFTFVYPGTDWTKAGDVVGLDLTAGLFAIADTNYIGGTVDNVVDQYNMSLTTGTATVVPLPAAVWLFGSGLLGLVGIARRKKAA